MTSSSKIIGIDLGTTNSVVAVMEGDSPTVVTNLQGSRITPSIVGFQANGERLVGMAAKHQAVTNPENTVFSIKRFMGRRHSEVSSEEKMVPYKISGNPDDLVKVDILGKSYTPPEVSAMVLQYLKESAEAYLGETIEKAVITVPAYFNDSQRQATKDAGAIAGLKVERIINEPTAAALAYGLDKKKSGRIAVYDFGGGTFDISILEVGDGVFEVLSTHGDSHLGGDDFDDALITYVAKEFQKDHSIDLRQDMMALQRLKEACEKAKCELSSQMESSINLPFITADQSGPKHLQLSISRAKFESLAEGLVERTRGPCEQAIKDAKLDPSKIDEVILVGGSTRIPAVQAVVASIFGKEPSRGVNPDEVVAVGAAIQGAVLSGDVEDVVLLDVTPLSLGIETEGGLMTKLIERNATIPTSKKETFSTAADNQTAVDIRVFQGERELAVDNRLIGNFKLDGIPPAPRGMPKVEVSFDIDANGILSVSAKDLGTGKEQSVRIESSSGLSKEEIEKMRQEAEVHADEDKSRRELIEAKNMAEQLSYQAEKTLSENGDKLEEADKKNIEDAVANLKKAGEGDDKQAIDTAVEGLNQAMHKVAEILYKDQGGPQPGAQAGPQPGPGATAGAGATADRGAQGGNDDDNIIDADFEVKD